MGSYPFIFYVKHLDLFTRTGVCICSYRICFDVLDIYEIFPLYNYNTKVFINTHFHYSLTDYYYYYDHD